MHQRNLTFSGCVLQNFLFPHTLSVPVAPQSSHRPVHPIPQALGLPCLWVIEAHTLKCPVTYSIKYMQFDLKCENYHWSETIKYSKRSRWNVHGERRWRGLALGCLENFMGAFIISIGLCFAVFTTELLVWEEVHGSSIYTTTCFLFLAISMITSSICPSVCDAVH